MNDASKSKKVVQFLIANIRWLFRLEKLTDTKDEVANIDGNDKAKYEFLNAEDDNEPQYIN